MTKWQKALEISAGSGFTRGQKILMAIPAIYIKQNPVGISGPDDQATCYFNEIAYKQGQSGVGNPLNSWSRQGGSNPRPADYESAALPLSYAGLAFILAAFCLFRNGHGCS